MTNKNSLQHASLYEFLLAAFFSDFDTSSDGDFYRATNYSKTAFLKASDVAVTDKNSLEHASLHEFLLTTVVSEIDTSSIVDFYHVANYPATVPARLRSQ